MNYKLSICNEFTLIDNTKVPFYIAYKDKLNGCSKIIITQFDQIKPRIIFNDGDQTLSCPLSFSLNGEVLYHSHAQIYAIDITSGLVRSVTNFSKEELFSVEWFLKCSHNNHKLLFLQSSDTHHYYNKPGPRICCINSDGSDFVSLLEGNKDFRICQADYQWQPNLLIANMLFPHRGSELWAMNLNKRRWHWVRSLPQHLDGLALSPDGRRIVFFYYYKGMYLLTIENGKIIPLSHFGTHPVWSPDGSRIAFMNQDNELWILQLGEMSFQKLLWVEEKRPQLIKDNVFYAQKPAWSADGRFLCSTITKRNRLTSPRIVELQPEDLLNIPEELKEYIPNKIIVKWDYAHKVCIVDFIEHTIFAVDGYWQDFAWSPT